MSIVFSRLGVVNAASATTSNDRDLFMEQWSGEVLTAWERKCKMKELHEVISIDSGDSSRVDAIGKATGGYHTIGDNRLDSLQSIKHNNIIINIDSFLVADTMTSDLERLMNHYDVRSKYTRQLADFLAQEYDRNTIQLACLAARASNVITGLPGGTILYNTNFSSTSSALKDGIFKAAQTLDENDVPEDDRYVILRPAEYYMLAQDTDVISRDWDGAGSISKGTVLELAGITIVKSNNLPKTSISAKTGERNTYSGDFSNTAGVVFHREAIGSVHLQDVILKSDEKIELLGEYIQARMAVGHGVLRPECAVELQATTAPE